MKRNQKLSFAAISAALAATLTLTAYFPYITYAASAVAGLVMLVVVIETDCKWALGTFLASAIPVLLFTEPQAKVLYLLFFGWYPIMKAKIETINRSVPEWLLKILTFNASIIVSYLLLSILTDITVQQLGVFGKYTIYALLVAANIVFVLYDIAVSQVASFFTLKLHPKIKKIFNTKK